MPKLYRNAGRSSCCRSIFAAAPPLRRRRKLLTRVTWGPENARNAKKNPTRSAVSVAFAGPESETTSEQLSLEESTVTAAVAVASRERQVPRLDDEKRSKRCTKWVISSAAKLCREKARLVVVWAAKNVLAFSFAPLPQLCTQNPTAKSERMSRRGSGVCSWVNSKRQRRIPAEIYRGKVCSKRCAQLYLDVRKT